PGRGDQHKALRGAERDSDHVAGEVLFITDARIETLRHNVDEVGCGSQVNPNPGISFQERTDDACQHVLNRRRWGVDPQPACGDVALTLYLAHCIANVAERGCEPCEQALACLGGCDAAGGSIEQPNSQPPFQFAQVLAQGGRGDLQLSRSSAEAPMPGYGGERCQVAEIWVHYSIRRTACSLQSVLSNSLPFLMIRHQTDHSKDDPS